MSRLLNYTSSINNSNSNSGSSSSSSGNNNNNNMNSVPADSSDLGLAIHRSNTTIPTTTATIIRNFSINNNLSSSKTSTSKEEQEKEGLITTTTTTTTKNQTPQTSSLLPHETPNKPTNYFLPTFHRPTPLTVTYGCCGHDVKPHTSSSSSSPINNTSEIIWVNPCTGLSLTRLLYDSSGSGTGGGGGRGVENKCGDGKEVDNNNNDDNSGNNHHGKGIDNHLELGGIKSFDCYCVSSLIDGFDVSSSSVSVDSSSELLSNDNDDNNNNNIKNTANKPIITTTKTTTSTSQNTESSTSPTKPQTPTPSTPTTPTTPSSTSTSTTTASSTGLLAPMLLPSPTGPKMVARLTHPTTGGPPPMLQK